ncbi:potassium uptake protein KtrA [Peptoniphilus sp. ING2-D1G]|nr:potassium uptake protein KtrA [Peptoniphilus sp. ING2-D1G]
MESFVVFGCGRFGSTVAKTLTELGNEVMAIDFDMEKVEDIADDVTTAIQCDILDENETKKLGLTNMDKAIIAIGSNIEAAIMAVLISKEANISYIIAKASNKRIGDILTKIGADKIIYPERDTAFKLAHKLTSNSILDYIQLSSEYSVAEINVLHIWVGKTIKELDFKNVYNATILGIERKGEIELIPYADTKLIEEDVLIVLGNNSAINKLGKF